MHDQLQTVSGRSQPGINDFIKEAIRLVRDGSETVQVVAARLGLRPALLQKWVSDDEALGDNPAAWNAHLVDSLRQENLRLAKECRRLRNVLAAVVGVDEEESK